MVGVAVGALTMLEFLDGLKHEFNEEKEDGPDGALGAAESSVGATSGGSLFTGRLAGAAAAAVVVEDGAVIE